MITNRILMIVIIASILPADGTASSLAELCDGSMAIAEGQWASFAVDAPFLAERLDSRYAIVGKEGSDYWMEFEVAMPMGNGKTIMKILISDWPYDQGTIKRAMMQLPTAPGTQAMPPMEMPPSSIKNEDPADPIRMACAEADKAVEESVTVGAGTFTATRIPLRHVAKDIWLSSDVPFGIVKMADSGDKGMELMAFGTDAEPAITAEPQKIPGMD